MNTNDKNPDAVARAVRELLDKSTSRRDALRRIGAGGASLSPLAMVACGGAQDERPVDTRETVAISSSSRASSDPLMATKASSFTAGANSGETLPGWLDTWLYNNAANSNYAGQNINPLVSGGDERRYLANFSGAGLVALHKDPGWTVTSVNDARLSLYQITDLGTSVITADIYPAAAANNVTQATWINASTGTPWVPAGGIASGEASIGTITFTGAPGYKGSSNLAAAINNAKWTAGGLIVKIRTPLGASVLVAAAETIDGQRPRFSATYTQTDTPTTTASFTAGLNSTNNVQGWPDTWLYNNAANTNYVGQNISPIVSGADERRYLANFNGAGLVAGHAGAGTTVVSVSDARLWLYQLDNLGTNAIIADIYPAAATNNVAQATWMTAATGTPWAPAGGIATGEASIGTITFTGAAGYKVSSNLAAVINNPKWAAGGLVVKIRPIGSSVLIAAAEHNDSQRPQFSATYTKSAASQDFLASLPAGTLMGTEGGFSNWDSTAWADAMWGASEFTPPSGLGEGPSISNVNASGFPQVPWAIKLFQHGNRPVANALAATTYHIVAVGTSSPPNLTANTNGTLSNIQTVGNTRTCDWTYTGQEPHLVLIGDAAITDLRVVADGYNVSSPPVWRNEAVPIMKRMAVLRCLNMLGQNRATASWTEESVRPMKHWGQKGFGACIKAAVELRNAPGSMLRYVAFNAPYKWQHDQYVPWLTYVKSQLPANLGVLVAGTNETWNAGTYPHFHFFLAQTNSQTTNPANGEAVWPISAADLARVSVGNGATDQYFRWGQWWALREARIAKACKAVFGTEFGGRCMFEAQSHFMNTYWHFDVYLPFLELSAQTTEFGPLNTYIHTLGGAPYLSPTYAQLSACTSAAQVIALLRDTAEVNLTTVNTVLGKWRAKQLEKGIRYHVLYEWNSEHCGYIFNPAGGFYVSPYMLEALRSPGMQTITAQMLALFANNGVRLAECLWLPPTTYANTNGTQQLPNMHWGMMDGTWNMASGKRSAAVLAHMQTTGQWV